MKRSAIPLAVVLAVLGPRQGFAQSLPLLARPGEPTGDHGDLAPLLATEPLRLSLTSTIFPMARAFEQCAARTEASGNSVNGAPLQRFQSWRLAPRLVLSGFSIAGCPIDGGMGGGVTYAALIRPALWLVASAGVYGVPSRDITLPAKTSGDVRLDLVKQTGPGRVLRFGIEQKMATGIPDAPFMVTFGMSGF